jgi:hypothetical protein
MGAVKVSTYPKSGWRRSNGFGGRKAGSLIEEGYPRDGLA